MDVDRQIAARLRSRRRLLGMTLQELAELCGTSFQTIQKYERGVISVSAARLWLLCKALHVEVGYFFDGLPRESAPPLLRPANGCEIDEPPVNAAAAGL